MNRWSHPCVNGQLKLCICNTKVAMARATLCVVFCDLYCILPAQCPPPSSTCFLPPPLFPSLLPCLPPCLSPSNSTYTVCVSGKLHCIVLRLAMRDTDTMGCSPHKKVSFQWPAVTFTKRAPTTNQFLTMCKKI